MYFFYIIYIYAIRYGSHRCMYMKQRYRRSIGKIAAGLIIVVVVLAAVGIAYFAFLSGHKAPPTNQLSGTLSETGSSLLYPLFNLWVPGFKALYPGVQLNTASTGSGTGISSAETGVVQIGASDAYMSNAQISQYPNILNIPLAISAQQINYNIPGLPASIHLNMSGPVLAQIYMGKILYWDDPAIVAANPGATQYLTHQHIIPIHRSDGSGDTFIFTQYLSKTYPAWNSSVGFGTSVSWPALQVQDTGNGNGGMVNALAKDKYGIAYIGVSYLLQTVNEGLGYAYLLNQAGNYVNITQQNIQAAANSLVSQTPPDERISLIYAPGANSYPIINYEYAIVSKSQPDANTALLIRTFLSWAISPNGGNSPTYLNQVGFIPLPSSVVQLSQAQINQIQGP
jgi:phosphate transport system substrate-binding protein